MCDVVAEGFFLMRAPHQQDNAHCGNKLQYCEQTEVIHIESIQKIAVVKN